MVKTMKLDTIDDVKNAVDNFGNLKPHMRMTAAFAIEKRLRELDAFVNVLSDNPILKYPSDRYLIQNKQGLENKYDQYLGLLRTDIDAFNDIIYNDISLEMDKQHGINDIICTCCSLNDAADKLFLREYPEMKDYIDVVKMAASKIISFFKSGISIDIVKTSLDDIEFIISTGMLSDDHVRRYLLPIMGIKDLSLYKNMLDKSTNTRLVNIFHTQILLVKHKRDEFMRLKNFNDSSLIAYLKIQKQTYEQILVDQEISSDYILTKYESTVDIKMIQELYDKYIIMGNKVNLPKGNDIFRLQQNGFKSITKSNIYHIEGDDKKPVSVDIYVKNGTSHLILKSKKYKDTFFFVTKHGYKHKNFKITLTNKDKFDKIEMNAVIESTFLNPKKMNRV